MTSAILDGRGAPLEPLPQPEPDFENAVQVIARAAVHPDANPEVIRELVAMRREERDATLRAALNRAFVAAKKQAKRVVANKHNSQTSSYYADLSAVSDAVDEAMEAHGLALQFSPEPGGRDGFHRVRCDLIHEAGGEKMFMAEVPNDNAGIAGKVNKTPTHAWQSSNTYGWRNLKAMIFDLAKGQRDDDGNAAGGTPEVEYISMEQREALEALIVETGADKAKTLKALGVDDMGLIPASWFDQVRQTLERRRQTDAAG